jgi:hypothetical protein
MGLKLTDGARRREMNRDVRMNRRRLLGGAAGLAALKTAGAHAQIPARPSSPVAINVIDVGGALALMQKAFEAYRKAKPEFVSRITVLPHQGLLPSRLLVASRRCSREQGR